MLSRDTVATQITGTERLWLALIIAIGLAFRLYAFHFDPVINPDGTLYIQQAKALYYRHFGLATACYSYLSIYPILISLCQFIVHDWVLAGVYVSMFFALATFVPLYLLMRQLVRSEGALLSLLTFSVMPSFVVHSHQVIRGPVFWFFSVLGLYLFVRYLSTRNVLYACLSSICFIIGAWSRVEGILFILASAIWIVIAIPYREGKLKGLVLFMLPVAVVAGGGAIYLATKGATTLGVFPLQPILARIRGTVANYHNLREQLKTLGDTAGGPGNHYFFGILRKMLWLVALGAVVRQILRSMFIPFACILVIGVFHSRGKIKTDRRLTYLATLCVGALAVLFVQTIFNWAIHSRHIAIFLFPAFVFLGLGFMKILDWLEMERKWNRKYFLVVLAILIVVAPLKKNLSTSRGADKLVYRSIGQFIARLEKNDRPVIVAGTFKRINLIHFYANENLKEVACFPLDARLTAANLQSDMILHKGFDYLVLDEKSLSPVGLRKLVNESQGILVKLGQWKAKKRGVVILFKVNRGHEA